MKGRVRERKMSGEKRHLSSSACVKSLLNIPATKSCVCPVCTNRHAPKKKKLLIEILSSEL